VSVQPRSGLSSLLASPRFEEENQRLLELNQRCQFASYATMQWLDIRLQLMGAVVVGAIAGIALVQHQQGLANPGPTLAPSLPLTPGTDHSKPCPRLLPALSPHNCHLSLAFPVMMCHHYHSTPCYH
jgi:hypothetical protein